MKKSFVGVLVLAAAFLTSGDVASAQTPQGNAELEKNLALVRKDLRSSKKQILAANLPLTDVEATRFWPVYDQYVGEMATQYDAYYGVIKDYAANQKTLTDEQAIGMIKRWADIQAEIVKVRQKYIALVEKVIPGKKAALFFQIDRRLYMLIDLQIAAELPLVLQ